MTTRAARDQVVGKSQAAGRKPSTIGIARKRLLADALSRAVDCADTLGVLVNARDSADPESQEIARHLLSNQTFLRAMYAAVEKIERDVKASMSQQPETPSNADPTAPVLPKALRGSGLPGTDSGLPGTYTEAQMRDDLATQRAAANTLVQRDPHTSMDAALARVARTPLVPDWMSPVWSSAARSAFRERALSDGFCRAHIERSGDGIGFFNDTATTDNTERAMLRLGAARLDTPQPHPRSFDR